MKAFFLTVLFRCLKWRLLPELTETKSGSPSNLKRRILKHLVKYPSHLVHSTQNQVKQRLIPRLTRGSTPLKKVKLSKAAKACRWLAPSK